MFVKKLKIYVIFYYINPVVLVSVDIPDIYMDVYNKSNPHNEKVDIKSLHLILEQLSGLSANNKQRVKENVFYTVSLFNKCPTSFFFEIGHEFNYFS